MRTAVGAADFVPISLFAIRELVPSLAWWVQSVVPFGQGPAMLSFVTQELANWLDDASLS
jgi:hypothetical protein